MRHKHSLLFTLAIMLMAFLLSAVISFADTPDYLSFTAKGSSATVTFTGGSSNQFEYVKNNPNGTWLDYTLGNPVSLNDEETVYFRNKSETSKTISGYKFSFADGNISADGDISTLLKKDGGVKELVTGCNFKNLFQNQTKLVSAPDLPFTTLIDECYKNMFDGCTNLTSAPELPATTLKKSCYSSMFKGCTSLKDTPELSADGLANYCYDSMFYGCTSLTSAPELPAETMQTYCYGQMFYGCINLETAPELPATTLANSCYQGMFYGCEKLQNGPSKIFAETMKSQCCYMMFRDCKSLINAPEMSASAVESKTCYEMFLNCTNLISAPSKLPATTLALGCYQEMFKNCIKLKKAPELPATTVAQSCYQEMFVSCEALRKAPYLPATALNSSCYDSMFKNCKNLRYICVNFKSWDFNASTGNWVSNVATYGIFIGPNNLPANYTVNNIPVNWCYRQVSNPTEYTEEEIPEYSDCLSFTAKGDDATVKLSFNNNYIPYEYAVDNSSDAAFTAYTKDTLINLNSEQTVYFRSKMEYKTPTDTCKFTFGGSGNISADGDVTTLIRKDGGVKELVTGCNFKNLFQNQTKLVSAPDLPSTKLIDECYKYMFDGCTNLTSAPKLPATTLTKLCYSSMFKGCTSLKDTPELSADELANNCYDSMFYGCTSLTSASALPAETMQTSCYGQMFYGCINLETAPELPATTLANSCYQGMFYGCEKLQNGPTKIFAETMKSQCCYMMFRDCKSLINAPEMSASAVESKTCYEMFLNCTNLISAPSKLPATTLALGCYQEMFKNCIKLKKAPELPATTVAQSCYQEMFVSCEALRKAPYLPATALNSSCYDSMFKNCKNIRYICVNFKSWNSNASTGNWVSNVATYGIFIGPNNLPANYTVNNIPVNWCYRQVSNPTEYTEEEIPEYSDCLSFTAKGDDATVKLSFSNNYIPYEYAVDNSSDAAFTAYTKDTPINLNSEQTVYFRSVMEYKTPTDTCKFTFGGSGDISADGDVTTLIRKDGGVKELVTGCNFKNLFQNQTKLVSAPDLPSTTLIDECYKNMFDGCTNLTSAPKLPATTLKKSCYSSMFKGCTSLKDTPELSADELANNCYDSMFYGCEGITSASALPAETMQTSCYSQMFYGCINLETAPELPATTLANSCYQGMFYGCEKLENVTSKLPAETLKTQCYYMMFRDCKSLINAPEISASATENKTCYEMFLNCTNLISAPSKLPATTLSLSCYQGMFKNCIKLKTAPELPATTVAQSCYQEMFVSCEALKKAPKLLSQSTALNCYTGMFKNCKNLRYICVNFPYWNDSMTDWVKDVAPYGILIGPNNLPKQESPSKVPVNWSYRQVANPAAYTEEEIPEYSDCLSFTAKGDDATVKLSFNNNYIPYEYAVDNSSDAAFTAYTKDTPINLNSEQTVYFRSVMEYKTPTDTCKFTFGGSGNISADGDVTTLIRKDGGVKELVSGCNFKNLFQSQTKLVSAPDLPSTTLIDECYKNMFDGCTNLTSAPKLPATTLKKSCYSSMFKGCTSLKDTPELSADELANNCYDSMFYGCEGITSAPELPAETMQTYCYGQMFYGCINLETAPELPATTLANSCYQGMFYGCEKLESAPELPAETLKTQCYYMMFRDCKSLINAPEISASATENKTCYEMFLNCTNLISAPSKLPATTLALGCYQEMFKNCINLKKAPELPATTLANNCYQEMFVSCEALRKAPYLPATALKSSCYDSMFKNCKNIRYICVNFESWNSNASTGNWVSNVATYGIFIGPNNLPANYNVNNIPVNWCYRQVSNPTEYTEEEIPEYSDCLSFTAKGDDATVKLSFNNNYIPYEYAVDNSSDAAFTAYTKDTPINLNSEQTVYFRSKMEYKTPTDTCKFTFGGLGNISADGDVTTLIRKDGGVKELVTGCNFKNLFQNQTKLVSAPDLPSTTLIDECYKNMFDGCTNLTSAPKLPATTLTKLCYSSMFKGCTSLKDTPELSADELANNCYDSMFYGCTSLTSASALPAETMQTSCYSQMFYGCINLETAPELPATTLANSCYQGMFYGCEKLESAPELPAETLKTQCYYMMFRDCKSLINAPEISASAVENKTCYEMFLNCTNLISAPSKLPATTLALGCYQGMFKNCIKLKTAPELPATTLANNCYQEMFVSCEALRKAPYLPATALKSSCYDSMFKNCKNIRYICVNFESWNSNASTGNWVSNVATYGIFIGPNNLPANYNVNNIPVNWCYRQVSNPTEYTEEEIPEYSDCLSFTAKGDDATVKLSFNNNYIPYEYAVDNSSDAAFTAYTKDTPINLNSEQTVYFRSKMEYKTPTDTCKFTFGGLGNISADGDVTTLIRKDGGVKELVTGCNFKNLFQNQTKLVSAPDLPSTTLIDECYKNMFDGCTNLTSAPKLPATTLKKSCYSSMFKGCTSLKDTPELSADELANNCYDSMFYGCTSLTSASALPAETMQTSCYSQMFYGCINLETAPELPATTLANSCYQGMFYGCEKLESAPELPAETLPSHCYNGMFRGCTGLTSTPNISASLMETGCCKEMFYGCTSLTSAPKILTEATAEACYNSMFYGCSELSYIYVKFKNWDTNCTQNWVNGVSENGLFVGPEELDLTIHGNDNVPINWNTEVINDNPVNPPVGPTNNTTKGYTIPVKAEDTVQVEATITNGKAEVSEISKGSLEEIAKPKSGKETTETIVIDISETNENITEVELTKDTIKNLADVTGSKKNKIDTVTVKMKESIVEVDTKSLKAVCNEAKGSKITLVVKETKLSQLENAQKDKLSKMKVAKTFEAYWESDGQRIYDFNGGTTLVKIKFTPEEGKKANNYKVYYINDDGSVGRFETTYKNGKIQFTTKRFSDYAIVYENVNNILLLTANTSVSNAIKLSWNAQDNATKYVIYATTCGGDFQKLITVKKTSYTVKKIKGKSLKPHREYKFYVKSYDSTGNTNMSRSVHLITANTHDIYSNVKSIKAKKSNIKLDIGSAYNAKVSYKTYAGKKHISKTHGVAFKYYSNNTDVATVSTSGKITAVGVGSATIYVQDIGGKYCKIKVTTN